MLLATCLLFIQLHFFFAVSSSSFLRRFQTGVCEGRKNDFKCTDCSNKNCGQSQVRTGTCSGTANGYQCNVCSNLFCAGQGTYRAGTCAGATDGFTCEKQPTCEDTETYVAFIPHPRYKTTIKPPSLRQCACLPFPLWVSSVVVVTNLSECKTTSQHPCLLS